MPALYDDHVQAAERLAGAINQHVEVGPLCYIGHGINGFAARADYRVRYVSKLDLAAGAEHDARATRRQMQRGRAPYPLPAPVMAMILSLMVMGYSYEVADKIPWQNWTIHA